MHLKIHVVPLYFLILLFSNTLEADRNSGFNKSADNNEWKLRKDAHGIQVFTREYPDLRVKEYKAVTVCNSGIQEVAAILEDFASYPNWINNCKSLEVIERKNETVVTNYIRIAFPWPLHDRDGIWQVHTIFNNDSIYMNRIISKPKIVPEKKGIVRMQNAHGGWKVEKLEDGRTKISQQFLADPGGDLPAWVVNLFLVDSPHDSFKNLRKLLGEKR